MGSRFHYNTCSVPFLGGLVLNAYVGTYYNRWQSPDGVKGMSGLLRLRYLQFPLPYCLLPIPVYQQVSSGCGYSVSKLPTRCELSGRLVNVSQGRIEVLECSKGYPICLKGAALRCVLTK